MAKFIIYTEQTNKIYSDGDVEEEILEIIRNGNELDDVDLSRCSFPILYHLSRERNNILNWFGFKEKCSILEVGSGCGAITRMLCEKASHVTSVELSERRARINYARNYDMDNLDIVVADFSNLDLKERYDYVVLNGVLEYAGGYTVGDDPYVRFLEMASSYLKDDGVILLAIENRLGAKYFAGTPEDHLDTFFSGINGYNGIDFVRTFSKNELRDLCRKAGLDCRKFYYPYPDYKFPREIFTDATINTDKYGKNFSQFNNKRIGLINEQFLNKSLAYENVAEHFANSFLVEITKEYAVVNNSEDILYVKLSTDRNDEFCIYTAIVNENDGIIVKKFPASDVAYSHIAAMKSYKPNSNTFEYLIPKQDEIKCLSYRYIEDENLDSKLLRYIGDRNIEAVYALFEDVRKVFFSNTVLACPCDSSEFCKVFAGTDTIADRFHCVENSNIDLILDNIFFIDGRYTVIDYEWVFSFPIPSEYILWRIINEAFSRHEELHDLIDLNNLYEGFGIYKEWEELFRKWEKHFVNSYVGGNKSERYAHKEYPVDIDDFAQNERRKYIADTKIYFDLGEGFCEENSLVFDVVLGDNAAYELNCSLPKPDADSDDVYNLRWDPMGNSCICSEVIAYIDGKECEIIPVGSEKTEDGYAFLSNDPYWIINGVDKNSKKLAIYGKVFFLHEKNVYKLAARLIEQREAEYIKLLGATKEKDDLIAECTTVISEKDELIEKCTTVICEKDKLIEKCTDTINEKDELISRCTSVINEKDEMIIQCTELIQEKDSEIARCSSIITSKDEVIANCTTVISEKDEYIAKCSDAIREKDSLIEQCSISINEKDELIKNCSRIIDEKDRLIETFSDAIKEKDEIIAEWSTAIIQKDELIGEFKQTIIEKEETINCQERSIEEKNEVLNGYIARMDQQDHQIEEYHSVVEQKDAELQWKDAYIKNIQNSRLWKIYCMRDKFRSIQSRIIGFFNKNRKAEATKEISIEMKNSESFPEKESASADRIHSNIEHISFEDGKLRVSGWIFDEEGAIEEIWLSVINSNNETDSNDELTAGFQLTTVRRIDVATAFNTSLAANCGFQGEFALAFEGQAVIKVCAKAGNDTVHIYAGTFRSDEHNEFSLKEYSDILIKDIEKCWGYEDRLKEFDRFREKKVDIIVPVYNGYKFLEKLFEGLVRTEIQIRIIVIDDCSTDEKVREAIQNFAERDSRVKYIQNIENVGFVKSINIGLRMTEADVVIVNTDVELPYLWLERLMAPIFENEKIASTTPFSNSATIFSFPVFGQNNNIYRGMTVDELDKYFSHLIPHYTVVPTGMGFCMGMSRRAINAVGIFDADTFAKGYGEENDWCRRAVDFGFINIIVENLFVYHKHGGSFDSKEKQNLLEANTKKLVNKHPDYLEKVARYCEEKPTERYSSLIHLMLDTKICEGKNYLIFTHCLGGGADTYLEQRIYEWINEDNNVFDVKYDIDKNIYRLRMRNTEYDKTYFVQDVKDIESIFKGIIIDDIIINELVTYPKLYSILDDIRLLVENKGARLVMLMHDYYAICPSINLLYMDNIYCREGEGYDCDKCLTAGNKKRDCGCTSIAEWQDNWKRFLRSCDEVRTFSQDTLMRMKKIYGDDLKYTIVPHKVEYLFPLDRQVKITDTINIGLLGVLSKHKGKERVDELIKAAEDKYTNVRFILVGTQENSDFETDYFYVTGKYTVENLPRIILENDIDLFLIASIWPETFSYTTEEIMRMGWPIASYNIGAPASRIRDYNKGIVIEETETIDELDRLMSFTKSLTDKLPRKNEAKYVLFVAEYISFSSRYRAEHAMEQLLCAGVKCRFIEVKDLPGFDDFENLLAVFVYRCRYQDGIEELYRNAKGICPIIYDIDDYIYDYSEIADKEFLKDDEYEGFEEYSLLIRKCMVNSDLFTTSTESLAAAIKKDFGKEVLVNRNVASMAMRVLSEKALNNKGILKNKKKTVLGYFSGSKTHNSDFEMITDTIIALMEKYENVDLLIVGCLELSERFNSVADRIVRKDFVQWQNLPHLLAGIDINLMPLQDGFFNECKSENKWTEAALVKTLTVASWNHELEKVMTDNVDVLFCRDIEQWHEVLERTIIDSELRDNIAQAAYEKVSKCAITNNSYNKIYNYICNRDYK